MSFISATPSLKINTCPNPFVDGSAHYPVWASTNYTVTLKPFIHNYLIKHNLIEVQIGNELKNN